MSHPLDELVGKTIYHILFDRDKDIMCFITYKDDADRLQTGYFYDTYDECCSVTYFHELIGVDALLNQQIVDIAELPLKEFDNPEDDWDKECIKQYGYEFITQAGRCTLVFRNESNGYYGGSINKNNDGEVVTQFQKDYAAGNIVDIKSDWINK